MTPVVHQAPLGFNEKGEQRCARCNRILADKRGRVVLGQNADGSWPAGEVSQQGHVYTVGRFTTLADNAIECAPVGARADVML